MRHRPECGCWSLNGRCTCNIATFWERRPLSLGSFPPVEGLTLGLDYTTQLGTEVESWWADRGDRGRMFTARFHIHWPEAKEKCFTVSTEHTGLKGWEMCHQVMNLEYQASPLQPLLQGCNACGFSAGATEGITTVFPFCCTLIHSSPSTLWNPLLVKMTDDWWG